MSSYSSNPGLSAAAVGTYPTRWKALVVLALAQVVLTLDNTVVNVALPQIGGADRWRFSHPSERWGP